jgi:hypothetical protein
MSPRIAIAALLMIPAAPVLAQSAAPALQEVWAPAGKTVKLYRQVDRADSCRTAQHHVPAGKLALTHAPDQNCASTVGLKAEKRIEQR